MSRVRLKLAYKIERVSDGELLTEAYTIHTYVGKDGRLLRITDHPEAWAQLSAMVKRET
jgi:acyl-CoA thioesterase FadM